jgi:hypothetical protein
MRQCASVLAIGSIACGSAGFSGTDLDTADVADSGLGWASTWSDGTQVGSEGLWGCTVESRTVIDADAVPEGFDASPADLTAPFLGRYEGEVFDVGSEVYSGSLTTGSVSAFERVDVVEQDGCEDYIRVEIVGNLSAGAFVSGSVGGPLGLRPDASRLALVANLTDLEGSARPILFAPADMDITTLTVSGDITATSLAGTMWFLGCSSGACITDDVRGSFSLTR